MSIASLRHCVIALGLVVAASPAAAQWTRVEDLPVTDVFALSTKGDTVLAGTNNLVYVSVDAGATWRPPTAPAPAVPSIADVLVRNGKLYAGTSGSGVFISNDLGQTWQAFNQGLVGGLFNSQLDIVGMQFRGDSLYAGTLGAGVYVRRLTAPSTWSHFGEEFEPNQASNINAIAVGGDRLLAGASSNGTVFFRDPGDPDWTQSFLDNVGLHPGFAASSAAFTGTGWVVGAGPAPFVFLSPLGEAPWTLVNIGLGPLLRLAFATRGPDLFAAFNIPNFSVIELSGDDGATWELMDVLPNVFVYRMAMSRANLFAGRNDGLWRRSTATVSVPRSVAHAGLRFALAGRQPVADVVRFRFDLPAAGNATIEVFDVAGRRAAVPVQQSWPAGPHEVSWDARSLPPGVYMARLTARDAREVVRLVHVR